MLVLCLAVGGLCHEFIMGGPDIPTGVLEGVKSIVVNATHTRCFNVRMLSSWW
jgi:hypothetical protein